MILEGKKRVYWWAQVTGWLIYFSILILYNLIGGRFSWETVKSGLIIVSTGILVSHAYRWLIIRLDWLKLSIYQLIHRVLISSLFFGFLFYIIHGFLSLLIITDINTYFTNDFGFAFKMITTWVFLMFFWSLFYFTANYFLYFKNQEIKNLRLQSINREINLNQLKSQLNPHFTFNALNSIRALVDENPEMAKKAVTQLSTLLRAALNMDVKRMISLREEIEFVESYLGLERIRFEERLKYNINIPSKTLKYQVPPLLVQTLVENAVKHGIGKLTGGGEIIVKAYDDDSHFHIIILNSGKYEPRKDKDSGLGIWNSKRRLGLLFGTQGKFHIQNEGNMVKTTVSIPKNPA